MTRLETCFLNQRPNIYYVIQIYPGSVADTTPPVVSNCPDDIVREVPNGTIAVSISWTEPTATDNVGILSFTPNVPSGQNFPADTSTLIFYTALDYSGNVDVSCFFTVTVAFEGMRMQASILTSQ